MLKKHFKMLCTMALFHSDGGHKEINVPEEEFLENQYLQDYYEEDEKYLERPEAQQFYKD